MLVLERFFPLKDKNQRWTQILAIFIACLGSFNHGSLFAWPSPSIPILLSNSSHLEPITIEQASYFSVIPCISSAITSLFIAILVDNLGRKKTVAIMAIPQFAAWILVIFAPNVYVIYLARILVGMEEACLFGAMPTYIGEISEPRVRGSFGNMMAINMYYGQLFINIIGSYCDIGTTAVICACLPVIHFILMLCMPESPYFLIMKQREGKAKESLKTLRWCNDTEKEYVRLKEDVHRQISESGTFKDLFTIPVNRKALLLSITIRGCQMFSGLAAFSIYTQYIFLQAGTNLPATTCSIIYSTVLVLCNSFFAFVVDKFGRKPLMTFSCGGCSVMLFILGTFFLCDQHFGVDVSQFRWIPLACMLIYIVISASGLGIIPTLMLGELFSASIKAKALCVLNISFAMYVLLVSKMYQYLSTNFGMYVPFFLFCVCCFMGSLFSYFYVPETKGKTLEEIQQSLGSSLKQEKQAGTV